MNFRNGAGDGLTDEVHFAELVDALTIPVDFVFGQNFLKEVAGLEKGDENDVARFGDFVGGDQGPKTGADFGFLVVIERVIAARGDEPEEAVLFLFEDAGFGEVGEGAGLDRVGVIGEDFEPVFDGFGFGAGNDRGEGGVEDGVVERCRLDEGEGFDVGVDAIGKGEVHENRTTEGVGKGKGGKFLESAGVLVQSEE